MSAYVYNSAPTRRRSAVPHYYMRDASGRKLLVEVAGNGYGAVVGQQVGEQVADTGSDAASIVNDVTAWASNLVNVLAGVPQKQERTAKALAEAEKAKAMQAQGTLFGGSAGGGGNWLTRTSVAGLPNWLLVGGAGLAAWALLRR